MPKSRGPSGNSRGGRAKGVPNKDKTELRAMTQEAVLEYTYLIREDLKRTLKKNFPDASKEEIEFEVDKIQPVIENYDPVVELALIGADYRHKPELRRQANADAAQYLRPKLQSIKLLDDPESRELMEQKHELASKLVGMLEVAAEAKRSSPPPSSDGDAR